MNPKLAQDVYKFMRSGQHPGHLDTRTKKGAIEMSNLIAKVLDKTYRSDKPRIEHARPLATRFRIPVEKLMQSWESIAE